MYSYIEGITCFCRLLKKNSLNIKIRNKIISLKNYRAIHHRREGLLSSHLRPSFLRLFGMTLYRSNNEALQAAEEITIVLISRIFIRNV